LKRISLLLAVITAISVLAWAVPAYAQGLVEQGTEHANSICSFSGLNDEPERTDFEGGRVQSYGQYVRQGLKSVFPSPGTACNGHLNPYDPENPPPEG
jgi:hypothetical protein